MKWLNTIYVSIAVCSVITLIISLGYSYISHWFEIIWQIFKSVIIGGILGFLIGSCIAISITPVTNVVNSDNYQIVSLSNFCFFNMTL